MGLDSLGTLIGVAGGLFGLAGGLFTLARRLTTREDVEKMIHQRAEPLERAQARTELILEDIRTQLTAVNVQLARLSVLIESRSAERKP